MILDFNSTGMTEHIEAVRQYNATSLRYAHVITFGCQQNEADSEKIRSLAVSMGYSLTDTPDEASLIILNTCAIREHAEAKALSMLGRLKEIGKKRDELIIGVAGCMAAEAHVAKKLKSDFKYVNFTVEPNLLYTIPRLVHLAIQDSRTFVYGMDDGNIVEGISPVRTEGHRAWVSIMYGCNNFCSYCIVPYVRGRERSRNQEDILNECRELVANGCKEITLLGQNVNSYKSDINFAGLIDKIADIDGDFIIRFMTSHPKDASDELIEVMSRRAPKIAPYFHLPLQSGSDRVLSLMNRRYTRERFLYVARQIKEKIPGVAMSTDIIVGFPTETDSDFEDTVSILKEVGFDSIYAFIYSPREGTPAAKMAEQIPRDISGNRLTRLLDLQGEISQELNATYLGTTQRVLVDSVENKDGELIASGRTGSNKRVRFPVDNNSIGHFINVKIDRTGAFDLFGKIEGETK